MRLYPDAVDRFLADPTSSVTTPTSARGYRTSLKSLQRAHPEAHLADFTEDMLVGFCARPGLSQATRASYRSRVAALFSWAAWRGHIPEDPSINLRRLVGGNFTRPVREHHWLSTAQVTEVLESIDTSTVWGRRAMVIARLGFTMGLRRAEIPGLRWDQVDLERQQARLTVTKGSKLAATFVTDATLTWLRKWHDEATEGLGRAPGPEPVIPRLNPVSDFKTGWRVDVQWDRPVGGDVISRTVKTISQAVGIPFSPHDMRRSFANMLEEQGYTIEEISAALRHSNLGTTQRYLEKRQDAAYQAVRKRGLDV